MGRFPGGSKEGAALADARLVVGAGGTPAVGDGGPRVGVILAAGRSERLRRLTGGRSKLLLHLGGLTLIERAVRTLLGLGLDRVVVVVGHHGDAIASHATGIDPERVDTVRAERWAEGNGESLAAVETAVAGEPAFLLVCSDHVFGPEALAGLVRSGDPSVLVDEDPGPDVWAEGTRVQVTAGRAVAFGKALPDPAVDCGAFVLGPEVFPLQRQAAADGDHSLAGAVTRLAEHRGVRAEPLPAGSWWQDVDTPEDLRRARRLLRRSLPKATDGPVSRYLNRPVSTRLTMALAPARIPPVALSILTLLVGLTAASMLAAKRPLIGGLLVHLSSVLDGMDGETARLQFRTSARGAALDNVLDRMVDAAVVAGLGLWVIRHSFNSRTILLLAAIAMAWALLAQVGWERSSVLGLPAPTERLLGFLLGGRDGRLFLVTAWALLGHPMTAILTFSVAWVMSVILRVVLIRRGVAMQSAPTG